MTFVLDDYADFAEASIVNTICEGILHAVDHPDEPRPKGEHIVVELTRQYVMFRASGLCRSLLSSQILAARE